MHTKFLVTFSLFLGLTSGLHCAICQSEEEGGCKDKFDVNNYFLFRDCETMQGPPPDGMVYTYCYKHERRVNRKFEMVTRGCGATRSYKTKNNYCTTEDDRWRTHKCYCNGDRCNGARAPMPPAVIAAALAAAGIAVILV